MDVVEAHHQSETDVPARRLVRRHVGEGVAVGALIERVLLLAADELLHPIHHLTVEGAGRVLPDVLGPHLGVVPVLVAAAPQVVGVEPGTRLTHQDDEPGAREDVCYGCRR